MSRYFLPLILFCTAIFGLVGCEKLLKTDQAPLTGDDVSVHSLADSQVQVRMKISGLTSNLWVTAEIYNNSGQVLQLASQNLIMFQDEKCLDVREEINEILSPLQPQERRRFRFSYYWKGRKKKDPLYEECKEKPLRFTLNGLMLGEKKVQIPNWTIQP
jgi:hypothetical protein